MAEYSIAEAKNNLPKLVDRMLAGEEVIITRRGKPVGRLAPALRRPTGDLPKSATDVEWLRRHQVTPKTPYDAVELIRQMRDDD
jgi:prevent-host-death family protein